MILEQTDERRAKEIVKFRRQLFLIQFVDKSKKSIKQECEEFGLPRSTFYVWKKKYDLEEKEGLKNETYCKKSS